MAQYGADSLLEFLRANAVARMARLGQLERHVL